MYIYIYIYIHTHLSRSLSLSLSISLSLYIYIYIYIYICFRREAVPVDMFVQGCMRMKGHQRHINGGVSKNTTYDNSGFGGIKWPF